MDKVIDQCDSMQVHSQLYNNRLLVFHMSTSVSPHIEIVYKFNKCFSVIVISLIFLSKYNLLSYRRHFIILNRT